MPTEATVPVPKTEATVLEKEGDDDGGQPPAAFIPKALAAAAEIVADAAMARAGSLPPDESKPPAAATVSKKKRGCGEKLDAFAMEKVGARESGGGGKPSATTPKHPSAAKKAPKKSAKNTAKAKGSRSKVARAAAAERRGRKAQESDGSDDDGDDGKSWATAIPFSVDDFPQLVLDESRDRSDLAEAFSRPLFKDPSRPLEIAYSHREVAVAGRRRAQRRKNAVLAECEALREKFLRKKLELSLASDEVKVRSREVGAWTRKVFDLELEEDCAWNANYKRLREYREKHGRLPPNPKKARDEEERSLGAWLDRIRGQKSQDEKGDDSEEAGSRKPIKSKTIMNDAPHRVERLVELGVIWENRHENKWESMFQRLLVYKEEMGTLHFPSDEQCAASGDEALIALQKWVKGQVMGHRYGKKRNLEYTKRLMDIGFDFDKWYAKPGRKPGKGRKRKREKVESGDFDEIETNVMEEGGCKPPADVIDNDDGGDVEMEIEGSVVL